MAKRYQIILTGKLMRGLKLDEIKGEVARLFKIDPDKVATFLSKPRIVKKDLDAEQTKRYRVKLGEMGLAVKIQPMPEETSAVAVETQPEKTIEKEPPTVSLENQPNMALAQNSPAFTVAPNVETPKNNKADIAELQYEDDTDQLVRPVYADSEYGIFSTWLEGMNRNSIIVGVIALFIGSWLWAWMLLETMKRPLYAFVVLGFVIGFCISKTGASGIRAAIFSVLIFISSVIGGRIVAQLYVFHDVDLWMTLTRFSTVSMIGMILGALAAFKGGLGYNRDK